LVDPNLKDIKGVRRVLLRGIFWRILIIETILLIWSLGYRALTDHHSDPADLFWFAFRIILLTVVIILFIMITFRIFLNKKIIFPLETIVEANRRLRNDDPTASEITLPPDAPREIKEIVNSRAAMLKTYSRCQKNVLISLILSGKPSAVICLKKWWKKSLNLRKDKRSVAVEKQLRSSSPICVDSLFYLKPRIQKRWCNC